MSALRPSSVFLFFIVGSVAQIFAPACQPSNDYAWTFNSLGQSPCYMAAAVRGACNHNNFTLLPLPTLESSYNGPGPFEANCSCSVVAYTLTSACGACQNAVWEPWPLWKQWCGDGIPGLDPNTRIPSDIKIPNWAFQNSVLTSGIWNASEAQFAGGKAIISTYRHLFLTCSYTLDLPELSAVNQTAAISASLPTETSSMGTSSFLTSTSQLAAPPSGTSVPESSNRRSTNVAAIAGGAVGGTLALVLMVAGLVWFFKRRHRVRNRMSVDLVSYMEQPVREAVVSPFMIQTPSTNKYYDPDDPSTFPSSMSSAGSRHTNVPSSYGGLPEI
ncbi:hypothetical protein OF83DRAFT_280158 [Amylostereum chailletii]|nr:hypothetical protein OF83DRAFT_280158 [Amylostereum chailletii]